MPHNDRPARDAWPVLPPTNKLAFDTPARAFLAADGWEERPCGQDRRRERPLDARLLPAARALFVVFAIVAIALCTRLAAKLFIGSVGAVAPVAALAEPRLD